MKTLFAAIGALAILPIAAATEVAVTYSDDFAEELADNYGEREGEELTEDIVDDLERAFARAGVTPARVDITIVNAKPNRPTFQQMRDEPGLDPFRSISIGGMKLTGTAYDADGNVLASQEYGWFENDILDVIGSGVWTDANRASRRFAKKLATQLSDS
ncbi:MAG: hypothetical protein VX599_05160 [Pseudomonadota bacterium]|nr:hypothetical protein [Pseudomonadota bacterium]